MKQSFLSSFLVVVIASVIIIGGAYAFMSNNHSLSPENVTMKFYSDWIDNSDNINPLSSKIYKQSEYLTDNYIAKVDSILQSFNKSAYDPILCAQDIPLQIKTMNTDINGSKAIVTVKTSYSDTFKLIDVELTKNNNNWLINDIICEEGELDNEKAENYVSPVIKAAVSNYIKNNIGKLSPKEAVLGGSFYVTSVNFIDSNTCIVDYEDGHIALQAEVKFQVPAANEVNIKSFQLIEPKQPQNKTENKNSNNSISEQTEKITNFSECVAAGNEPLYPDCPDCQPYCETASGQKFEKESINQEPICLDMCGNDICEEVVCLGSGCPCAETVNSCPEDCL